MENDAGVKILEVRVDGGAAKNDLLMQFQADLIRVPIVRPQITELTALGAAFLAGLAVGFWKEVSSYWKEQQRFIPQKKEEEALTLCRKWNQALRCAQLWEDK